jgi:NAD(P)-dependent dehydrogenase (short-subunit alcohol dehydrogenase family)
MGSRMEGKVALVTGSTRGIGKACARIFSEEGASVVVNDQGAEPELASAALEDIRSCGGTAEYFRADVADPDALRALVRFAAETYGRLDVLMNNAFSGKIASVTEMEDDDWDRIFAVTLKAIGVAGKAAVPEMRRAGGGSIINVSSVHGVLGARDQASYSALKAGIINLTRSMAVDCGRDNIRVNALCPGRILTEAKVEWLAERPDEVRRQRYTYPLGRPGTMREIARAALFLASDESSFVTGHALMVDGGLTAQMPDSTAAFVEKMVLRELDSDDQ